MKIKKNDVMRMHELRTLVRELKDRGRGIDERRRAIKFHDLVKRADSDLNVGAAAFFVPMGLICGGVSIIGVQEAIRTGRYEYLIYSAITSLPAVLSAIGLYNVVRGDSAKPTTKKYFPNISN